MLSYQCSCYRELDLAAKGMTKPYRLHQEPTLHMGLSLASLPLAHRLLAANVAIVMPLIMSLVCPFDKSQ